MRIVFEERPLRLPSGETATLAAPFAMGTGAGAINPAIRLGKFLPKLRRSGSPVATGANPWAGIPILPF